MSEKHTPGKWEVTPNNPTVQNCCLAYGAHSFPGPMRNALICHLSLLRKEHPEWEAAPALLDNLKKANQELTRCRRTPDYAQRQKGLISALQNELEAVIAQAEKEG